MTLQETQIASSSERLGREDWIDEAWRVLGKGSMSEVKVNILAKNLGVTRGSFYWHFKNREELVDAILDRWFSVLGVRESIEPRLSEQDNIQDRLFSVFRIVIEQVSGGQSIALRLQAKSDLKLRRRIDREDERRRRHFQSLFIEMGAPPERAMQLANLYHAMAVSEYLRCGGLPVPDRLRAARELHDAVIASVHT